MIYSELLQKREWHQKCQKILDRDKFRCHDCGYIGFHNKAGSIRLKSIEELDSFFSDWTYNGQPISKIIESLESIEFEKIDTFKDEQLFSIYQNAAQVVRIEKLLGKNTDYFNNPRAVYNYIMAYDSKQELSLLPVYGMTFYKKNGIAKINIPYSYTHILKFDKPITKDIYICFVGGNYSNEHGYINSEYEIGISYNKYYIHLSAVANELLYKGLNIHHKYYILGKKPWEYPDDTLVTLCEDCHKKRHQTMSIPMLDSQLRYIKDMQICDRCGGSGYLPQYHHVEHGICFKCGGEGISLYDVQSDMKAAMK